MQTQELYDKLKRKAMMGQMQHAAEDAVDANLYAAAELGARGPGDVAERLSPGLYPEANTMYQPVRNHQTNSQRGNDMYSAQVSNQPNPGAWNRTMGSRSKFSRLMHLHELLTINSGSSFHTIDTSATHWRSCRCRISDYARSRSRKSLTTTRGEHTSTS